ncbi:class I SAM-dependent DNA methyltransferase [Paractinoplanes rishiriensis]|uniref:Methyltransferase n=1 Tax=Paractinoplanes rishiriensis TaxID=1050105 RepID=A0A919JZK1_9ACTN|nr:class I SAM-dependent methyltransferase [Actinoplanes rishiriensis]GIE96355.1 methyltransferase [Actinoplanes rishiriensis]
MSGEIERAYLARTRAAYDTVAADYADVLRGFMADATWDRAVLNAFAELVDGPVVDVGCGPGRITGYLAERGLDVSGIDLSPQMVEVARREHPGVSFRVGSLLALDLADASINGLVAWYSLVHTPKELLPAAFAEFARVLRPQGHLLIAFKAGDDKRHITTAYGHDVDVDTYDYPPQAIADLLAANGIRETMRLVRAAEGIERQPQAYLLGVKA